MNKIKSAEYSVYTRNSKGRKLLYKSNANSDKKLRIKLDREMRILSVLNTHISVNSKVRVPRIYKTYNSGTTKILRMEYINGKLLHTYHAKRQLYVFMSVLAYLKKNNNILSNVLNLPRQSLFVIHLSLLKVALITIIRGSADLRLTIRLVVTYIRSFLSQKRSSNELFFTHGDIHSKNILVSKETIYLIDFNNSGLAPKGMDLAILVKFLLPSHTHDQIAQFINEQIRILDLDSGIISLIVYQLLFTLAFEDKDSPYFKSVQLFAQSMESKLLQKLKI